MDSRIFPRGVKLAIDLIRRDPARAWTVDELARPPAWPGARCKRSSADLSGPRHLSSCA